MRYDADLHAEVNRRVRAFPRVTQPVGELRHAAVACVVAPTVDGAPGFVITLRSPRTPAHAGQWALPGGRVEPGETAEETARRELQEETGLDLGPEAVFGLLDDYPTRSGHLITPVVMWAGDDPQFRPDPREVAELYVEPFAALHGPGVPRLVAIPDSARPVIQLPILGLYIHAPTAAVLWQFSEVAMLGRNTRVAHYEQPRFAWR